MADQFRTIANIVGDPNRIDRPAQKECHCEFGSRRA
jgi:hypothetical protein